MKPDDRSSQPNYSPYRHRWIALVNQHVVGVGDTAAQAHQAAKTVRPKARPAFYFVDETGQAHPQPPDLQAHFAGHPLFDRLTATLHHLRREAYLVGGAVRDGLLGRFSKSADLDLAVPRGALPLSRQLADRLGGAYYPVDPEREVGRVVLDQGINLDIAVYRGKTLTEDLTLRDFTLNAIALKLDPHNPYLIDPLGGWADLANRILRLTGPTALQDDPLRTIRAVRLAAQFSLTMPPETLAAIQAASAALTTVSAERLRDELVKLFKLEQPGRLLHQLRELGLLPYTLPEMLPLVGLAQSTPHCLAAFDHTAAVMDQINLVDLANPEMSFLAPFEAEIRAYLATELAGNFYRRTLLVWAALLHDIGKPQTFEQGDDGRIHFYKHPQIGAEIARRILARHRFSSQATRFVTTIVRDHMRPLLLAVEPKLSQRAIHRFLEQTGDAAPAVALLALLDHRGTCPGGQEGGQWSRLTAVVEAICQDFFTPSPSLLLGGRDVMALLQLPPGPQIGRILKALKEAQAIGEVETKDEAIAFIRQIDLH